MEKQEWPPLCGDGNDVEIRVVMQPFESKSGPDRLFHLLSPHAAVVDEGEEGHRPVVLGGVDSSDQGGFGVSLVEICSGSSGIARVKGLVSYEVVKEEDVLSWDASSQ